MKHYLIAGIALLFILITTGCRKENEPLITADDFVVSIDENPLADAEIGTIDATCREGSLVYSLKSSSPDGAFDVDETGMLTVADPFLYDYETNPVITGVVTLECDGEEKDINITINLNDKTTYYAGIRDITGLGTIGLSRDYLFGEMYTLAHGGTLISINLIGNNTGSEVQMAVYRNNNGVPGTLVAASETGTVGSGEISLRVNPVNIDAGDYWIMAIYQTTGSHTFTLSISNVAYYINIAYGSEIPADGSSFTSFSGSFAYSITVE